MDYTPKKGSTYYVIYNFLKYNEILTRDKIKELIAENRNKVDRNTIQGVLSYIKRKKLVYYKNNHYRSAIFTKKPDESNELYVITESRDDKILYKFTDLIETLKKSREIPQKLGINIYEIVNNKKILLAFRRETQEKTNYIFKQ